LFLGGNCLLLSCAVLTVRLLISSSGTGTSELLGLASSRVSDDQGSVVSDEGVSDLLLGGLIDELLVVSQKTLGDGLSDGVDLRGVTTASDSDSHVNLGEILLTQEQDGLEGLDTESGGVEVIQGDTVDSDHTSTGLNQSNSDGVPLATKGLDIISLG
jgi:hypothetical protein